MKKLFFLLLIFLITGCEKSDEDVINSVRTHYNEVETISNEYIITTNLSDKAQDFCVNFLYNKDGSDIITVLEPESIKGLEMEILKDETPMISFDNVFLETFIEENLGASPADMLSFAIYDLKEKEPSYVSVSDTIKLTYEYDKISKDVYLNLESYDIIGLEVYVDGNMITNANIKASEG